MENTPPTKTDIKPFNEDIPLEEKNKILEERIKLLNGLLEQEFDGTTEMPAIT
jgi:hypothetical protein